MKRRGNWGHEMHVALQKLGLQVGLQIQRPAGLVINLRTSCYTSRKNRMQP